jgi:signal peptidase I
MNEENNKKNNIAEYLKTFLIDFLETGVITIAIAVVIYIFISSPHIVVGESMMPNFVNGEYLINNKLGFDIDNLKRGQVINFQYDPTEEFIKRVIGLPGNTIELKNGNVYINGKLLDESAYIPKGVKTYGGEFLANNVKFKVPQGEYFVMGDNRENSFDSRSWGLVKQSAVKGIAFFVFWPLNKFGFVPTVTYTTKGNVIYSKLNRSWF